jgi:hypothetical protein
MPDDTALPKAWVLENLRLNAERALQQRPVLNKDEKESGEYKYDGVVANQALELIGKEIGMFINRREHGGPGDFASLTDEELHEQIVQDLMQRGLPEHQPASWS